MCTDNLGESAEEIGPGRLELVATDEPTVITEPFLDAIVVEDGQSDRCLPNPTCTDESDGCQVVHETDDLFDQFVAPKEGPRWGWWQFSRAIG